MEKVIVLFSVPLFLLLVTLIAVFVLANYSGNEPTKTASTEVKTPDSIDTTESTDNLAT